MSAIYPGPQCPICKTPLQPESVRTGTIRCGSCLREFEGTAFQPREVQHASVEVVTETPDGVAAACANHARNAAVSSCNRCGLFICTLCEMNVGGATYCPSCFDFTRNAGTLQGGGKRFRDFATMAVTAAVVGLFCAFPVAPFAVYWAIKGIRQRREEGTSAAGPIAALVLGILESVGVVVFISLMIVGMVTGS